MPLFSVVIPIYNRVELGRRAIESVLAQTCTDREVIVVDDGSTDDTSQMLDGFGSQIRVVRQENAGPGPARNRGIALATGEYVAFLDSDDRWFPWTLATYARAIEEYDRPSIVAGAAVRSDASEAWDNTSDPRSWQSERHENLLAASGNAMPHAGTPSLCIKTAALQRVGGFVDRRFNAEDQDLWLRLGCEPGFIRILTPPVFVQLWSASSVTWDLAKTLAGVEYLFHQELAGRYPGGERLRPKRRALVASTLRWTSMLCLEHGRPADAWRLYRQSWWWQAALRRWRYLLAFPVLAVRAAWRGAAIERPTA
jgi:hypothetical protein